MKTNKISTQFNQVTNVLNIVVLLLLAILYLWDPQTEYYFNKLNGIYLLIGIQIFGLFLSALFLLSKLDRATIIDNLKLVSVGLALSAIILPPLLSLLFWEIYTLPQIWEQTPSYLAGIVIVSRVSIVIFETQTIHLSKNSSITYFYFFVGILLPFILLQPNILRVLSQSISVELLAFIYISLLTLISRYQHHKK